MKIAQETRQAPWPPLYRSLRARRGRRGYVLFLVLGSLAVLSIVAGQVLMRATSAYRGMHRAANWREALVTAEAGVDIAIAELTGALPDIRLNSEEGIGLGLPASLPKLGLGLSLQPGSSGLPVGLKLDLRPPPLRKSGEGSELQQAEVSIEVLPLDAPLSTLNGLLSGSPTLQIVRLKSTGTAYLDASRAAGFDKEENALRRVILQSESGGNGSADRPRVSRSIEVLLKPVLGFQDGFASQGAFLVDDSGAIFDSFNSLSPGASTDKRYDPAKRREEANLQTNGAQLNLAGWVHGDVSTNGGNAQKTERITGTVDNARYRSLPPLRPPTWNGSPLAPSAVNGTVSVSAGSLLSPTRYKFTHIKGTLEITPGMLGLGSHVEIWVTGDITGAVRVADGVQAKFYVQGTIDTGPGAWRNESHRASNLQIYGLGNGPKTEAMMFSLRDGMEAAIYAPEHQIVFAHQGDFSGAVAGGSIWVKSRGGFHYDEALALNAGPILRFDIAGWRELTAPE